METNFEKAKRLLIANAYIQGIELKGDEYLFEMLELASTPDEVNKNNVIHDVSKPCHTTEIVQKWPNGTEEVKYRAPFGSKQADDLMHQVNERANKSGYFYRHVC